MINTEIFLLNYKLNLTADLSTRLTYCIDDVKDFAARNTTFSKTIILPGTAWNNKIFGNIFDPGNGNFYDSTLPNIGYNFNAAKSVQCFIFQNNIQVFKGVLRLLKVIDDRGQIEYECAVFGELTGLVGSLGNKRLEDLDFSANDHTYSVANIVASWTPSETGSGYYYPLMDYGNYSVNKHDWDIRTFRPALYVKEYIDKIFEAAGYTYNCDLFSTPRFRSLIIPNNQKRLQKSQTALGSGYRSNDYEIIWGDGTGAGYNSQPVPFETIVSTSVLTSISSTEFKFMSADSLSTTISYNVSGSYWGNKDVRITVKVNGVAVYESIQILAATNAQEFVPFIVSDSCIVTLNQNDIVTLYAETTDSVDPSDIFTFHVGALSFSVVSSVPTLVDVGVGDTVSLNSAIPRNILQKDFLASIVKMFNLYLYESRDDVNKIYIKPYPDFFNTDLSEAVDWSRKLNRARPIEYIPMSELNSRYYEFKFKSDNDYYNELYQKRYNENYGDRIFDSEFEFVNEKTTVEVIFSGTPLVGYNGEDKVYPTVFKRTGNSSPYTEENIDFNIRILQSKVVSGVSSWDIKDGATVLSSETTYGYAGHLDDPDVPTNDLNFGATKELFFPLVTGALNVNQFNVYWSTFMSEITDKDSKLLSAYFRLTPMDIYNLDFSKYVFIDGNLYALNKIEDYNAVYDEDCRVTLLKVIDSTASATASLGDDSDQSLTYIGQGTEGMQVYIPQLQGKKITILYKGEKVLKDKTFPLLASPRVYEYKFNNVTGQLRFGNDIEPGQIITIMYKTA